MMYQTGFKYELPADSSSVTAAAPGAFGSPQSMSSSTTTPTTSGGVVSPYLRTVSPESTGTGYHAEANHVHSGYVSELHGWKQ